MGESEQGGKVGHSEVGGFGGIIKQSPFTHEQFTALL